MVVYYLLWLHSSIKFLINVAVFTASQENQSIFYWTFQLLKTNLFENVNKKGRDISDS